jgi:DNA repair photolyase
MAEHNHPCNIITKSAGVLRDLDLLGAMGAKGLVKVHVSVTTLDGNLARKLEPRASAPHRRLAAIRGLAEAGVPVGVLAAPMIPALNDAELDAILEAARAAGASEASYILIRLPLEIRDLFIEWLHEHYPDRAKKVLGLIRETRGGKDYDSTWGTRMTGTGAYAELLRARFRQAVARHGFAERSHQLRTDLFAPPEKALDDGRQMALF